METLIVIFLLLFLITIGSELFVVIGLVSVVLFALIADLPLFALVKTMFDTVNKPALLAIPLYVFAGAIMAKGEIAKRLIELASATFGSFKGGLAVASVLACMFFAAISGSSPVTLIAIGSIMYPALIAKGYPEKTSVGVLTVSGSLGILIPPSIPMIVFAIVTTADVNKLFIAGIVPGILASILLMLLSIYYGYKFKLPTEPFALKKFLRASWHAIPALIMPALVLGGIYAGIYTVTEAASVAAVYAIIAELVFFRQMKLREIINVLHESVIVLGIIFIIIAMATMFNYFLTVQDVPFTLLEWLEAKIFSREMFLLMLVGVLLVAGLFMDVISAILIIAPLVFPSVMLYEIDPIHLGIIFIVALEIGYLTPPIGINLFVASGLFNKPFSKVIAGSVPFMMCLFIVLVLVMIFPEVALWLTEFLAE